MIRVLTVAAAIVFSVAVAVLIKLLTGTQIL